jgi:Xaa-Pro dipeptidase
MARTGVVGESDPTQAEIFAHLRATQQAIFETIEVGRPSKELYETCRREFEQRSLPFSMPHVGHGLGVGLHEAPFLHPGNDTPLEPGMVMAIEPLTVMADRREAYHTEDLVLVTEDGHRLLSSPQEKLLVTGGQ